jgi:catechol 2,3-dioxygenase-like lactoylglutathione lyase family enzyme
MSGVKELGHLVLYVRDVGRSADFYRDVLGWRQVFPGPGEDPTMVAGFSSGRTHHELLLIEVGEDAQPVPAGRRVGLYHFGLKVGDTDDELRDALARVRAAGATVVGSSDHGVTHSV